MRQCDRSCLCACGITADLTVKKEKRSFHFSDRCPPYLHEAAYSLTKCEIRPDDIAT